MKSLSVPEIQKILNDGSRRCHLVGVAGSGMSGLAAILLDRGHRVSGSDMRRTASIENLIRKGLVFKEGHSEEHLGSCDLLAYSSAIREENPERKAAHDRGIPQGRRAEVLAAACADKKFHVVSGTHGKTTTAAMLAHVLKQAERRPSYYIGAEVPVLAGNAALGEGAEMVVEADESDGSMSVFRPFGLIVLNIEAEHMDHFKSMDEVERAYLEMGVRTEGGILFCGDDPVARKLFADQEDCMSYGEAVDAAYRFTHIRPAGTGSVFTIERPNGDPVEVQIRIPGIHNVSNATAVYALAEQAGVTEEQIVKALGRFRGARRRFEVLFESEEYMVVNDYAHHPSEIKATVAAAASLGRKRVVGVFQPHRYSRTQFFHEEFSKAFDAVDHLYLTEIYAASEDPIEGVTGQGLAASVMEQGQSVTYIPSGGDLKTRVSLDLQQGDLLLVMGAGDIESLAHSVAEDLKSYQAVKLLAGSGSIVKAYEPMSRHTSLRVGGPARVWCEPSDEKVLAGVLAHCSTHELPVAFIGRGSNLLVKDRGIPGVCINLAHSSYSEIRVQGECIEAGAGARLRQIVAEAQSAGIGGLEFLEGIPASLGGALRMNAGAMGGSVFDVIKSVKVMDMRGNISVIPKEEIEVKYRNVPLLKDHVALGAVLKGFASSQEEIAAKIEQYSSKRWDNQPAAPSCGCTFKNPEGVSAGKLIDELGLKNTAVGGARVSDVHANFIVTEAGATADDVIRLIELIKNKVQEKYEISLETEVVIVGE